MKKVKPFSPILLKDLPPPRQQLTSKGLRNIDSKTEAEPQGEKEWPEEKR